MRPDEIQLPTPEAIAGALREAANERLATPQQLARARRQRRLRLPVQLPAVRRGRRWGL